MGEGRVLQVLGPSTGGIRAHVEALRAGLVERDWDVVVAAPSGGDVALPVPAGLDPVDLARAVRRLRGLLAAFDLVHAHGLKAGWTTSLARARPWVLTVHNVVLPGQGGVTEPMLRRLERRLPARADAVIATSAQLGSTLDGLAPTVRPHVIPPVGPAPRATRPASEVRRELGVAEGTSLLVGVGRLHPQKGWPVLLEALAQLRPPRPVRVVIAGEGPLEGELRARLAALDLEGVVALVGQRPDAVDLLAAADVVVVTSSWESGPLVLAEAMTLGRPVVATPVGFAADLIDDGVTGWLVPVGDAAALADALNRGPVRSAGRGARWSGGRRSGGGRARPRPPARPGRRRLPPGPAAHVRRAVPMVLAALAVVLGLGGLVASGAGAAGAATPTPPVERILVVSYPRLTWELVADVRPPTLLGLLERGAAASMSVQSAAARTDAADGYLTLGAGNRADTGLDTDLGDGGDTALGAGIVDTGTGEVVVAAAGELRRHNDDLLYGAEPGALGEALVSAGRSSAVVANADVVEGAAGLVLHREAALAMMDASGRTGGSVAPDLAVVDPGGAG